MSHCDATKQDKVIFLARLNLVTASFQFTHLLLFHYTTNYYN